MSALAKVKRLSGPRTHISWTPDSIPVAERIMVSIVGEEELVAYEARYRADQKLIKAVMAYSKVAPVDSERIAALNGAIAAHNKATGDKHD